MAIPLFKKRAMCLRDSIDDSDILSLKAHLKRSLFEHQALRANPVAREKSCTEAALFFVHSRSHPVYGPIQITDVSALVSRAFVDSI